MIVLQSLNFFTVIIYMRLTDARKSRNIVIFVIDFKKRIIYRYQNLISGTYRYSTLTIAIPVFSVIRIECQITSVQCFKCCLIFNLWHVILHAFWMKFMYDLSRITKTENTGYSVIGNYGVCGLGTFITAIAFTEHCVNDTNVYTHIISHLHNMIWKISIIIACSRFQGFANICYFILMRSIKYNDEIQFNRDKYRFILCYEYIGAKQCYFIYYTLLFVKIANS